MTQQQTPDHDDAKRPDFLADEELRTRWYRYAATVPGSIEALLATLRARRGQSTEEQQTEFAISANDFARLQSLRSPRPNRFILDAERIALACHVGEPFTFVQALLLARNLIAADAFAYSPSEEQNYEAAYDAADSMRDPEDKD
jgi:hypothetical protein